MEQILKQILNEIQGINKRLDNLEQNQSLMQSQITENAQILKALEHKVDVVKAEQDNFTYQQSQIASDVKSIKSAVVKGEKAYEYLQNFNKFSIDK